MWDILMSFVDIGTVVLVGCVCLKYMPLYLSWCGGGITMTPSGLFDSDLFIKGDSSFNAEMINDVSTPLREKVGIWAGGYSSDEMKNLFLGSINGDSALYGQYWWVFHNFAMEMSGHSAIYGLSDLLGGLTVSSCPVSMLLSAILHSQAHMLCNIVNLYEVALSSDPDFSFYLEYGISHFTELYLASMNEYAQYSDEELFLIAYSEVWSDLSEILS